MAGVKKRRRKKGVGRSVSVMKILGEIYTETGRALNWNWLVMSIRVREYGTSGVFAICRHSGSENELMAERWQRSY